jgi:hypothetical protein
MPVAAAGCAAAIGLAAGHGIFTGGTGTSYAAHIVVVYVEY